MASEVKTQLDAILQERDDLQGELQALLSRAAVRVFC